MNPEHLEFCGSDEWLEVLRDLILPPALAGVSLGDNVLEVGPGPGRTTDLLRAELPKITAVELDQHLAEALAERLANTNVHVVQADATGMPFDDGHFTGAVSFTMLHHVPTADGQDRLFAEVARVLQPGGTFVACDSVAREDLAEFHHDDIYNPVDPTTLESRLQDAGFRTATIQQDEFRWIAHATR